MGLYRDETGRLIDVDDGFAQARGYVPAEPTDLGAVISEAGKAERQEQRGIVGDINAFATGAASGLTLGLSDVALANSLTPFEQQRLREDLEAHPNLRTAGEIGGALTGGFAAPGSLLARTPAGYLGAASMRGVESGLAQGGARGGVQALAAMGAEGAVQNAGQYIGHSAIEDKAITAEGLTGSATTGFAFGAIGGGAALGVVKGAMAARRLYSRVMDGPQAAVAAESSWKLASQEALDADTATLRAAESKLEAIRTAKMEAQRGRNEARAIVAEERARAGAAAPRAAEVAEDVLPVAPEAQMGPEPLIDVGPQTGPGGVTTAYQKPNITFDPSDAKAFDEGMPSARDQVNDVASRIGAADPNQAKTGAFQRPQNTQKIVKPDELSAVEAVRSEGRNLEVRITSAGGTETRVVSTAEAADLAASRMPEGFTPGAEFNPRSPFKITNGVPAAAADITPNTVYVARPSELMERGLIGNELKAGGEASIAKAWGEGKKLPPVDVNVTPDGKFYIEDGNHRLAAALADDRPIAINFRKVGADFKPQAGARPLAPTDLEGQLAGTKAQLDDGAALKNIKGEKPLKAGKGNDSDSIEGWLQEKKAFDDTVDAADVKGASELRNRRNTALSEIRYKATEELLGPQAAKMERELQDIVDEYAAARKELGEISDGVPEPLDGGEIGARRDLDASPTPRGGRTAQASPGKRGARQIIDDAHEEALLRAKYAADPQEAGRALTEADELENLLQRIDDTSDGVPRMVDGTPEEMFGDALAADIKKIWRYEEASAKLADAVGESSHPTSLLKAKALRDAAKDSERKVMERTTRAIEDVEHFGPTYKTPKERVGYARERLADAQRNVDELGVQAQEARDAFNKAGKQVRIGEKSKRAALSADAKAGGKAGGIGAADAGGILEIIDMPGLPKPSDLPIVGPLLGAFLKFRTLKKAMGKAMGKVPATADAQVAARASQTRDRIARAVDRSLGLAEKGGKFASRAMPPAAGILAYRVYDDGGEDPGPKAPIQKQAMARLREINAYVHTPNAIELDVRRELRGVTDPDLIAETEKIRRFMMEYILKHAPKVPDQGLIKTHEYEISPAQAMSLARRMEAATAPSTVFERLAQERDVISLEAAETVRDVYPRLFQEALRRAVARASEAAPGTISRRTQVQMSLFYKMPFDPALEPENMQITQSVYERRPATPAPPQGTPPVPSVAQPTDLAKQYMTSFDRR